jgi:hypothetical protein
MLKPTSFADLATPQIAQETWLNDLPDHLRLAAQDWAGDVSAPRFPPVAADGDDTGAGHTS